MSNQKYRIFIAGHSNRHVFGTNDPKAVVRWLYALKKGQTDFPPHSDWSVERKDDFVGWTGIGGRSRDSLCKALDALIIADRVLGNE